MNKLTFFGMALMACFIISQLPAEESLSHQMAKNVNHGSQTYGKEMVEEIHANGFVKLDGTRVTDHLQASGQINLDRCLVKQKSIVCGALVATNSKFANELSISSESDAKRRSLLPFNTSCRHKKI